MTDSEGGEIMPREGGDIRDLRIEDEMKDSYLTYAMSVIVSRALPDVRDGLKPSQRRILVAMRDLGLTPRARYSKCASIVGETMKKYHPHGDGAIYPTLVRMAQDFNIRVTLIDPQGNFGSIDGDPPAAMRYTEARATSATMELLEDIEKNTVEHVPNFDDSLKEPTILPGRFPNLLVNGCSGIAVGMATSIPPHNVVEICEGLIALIDDPGLTDETLLRIVKGPDFPTGGIICGSGGIRSAYTTGRGRVIVRARVHIEEGKGGRVALIVTEIPYQIQKSLLIERIAHLAKDGTIPGISDVRDESDREGMRIVIEVKRGEDEQVVLNQLYKHSQLQDTFSIIMIALVDYRPRTLSLRQLMVEFRDHRMEIIRRRTRFLLDKAQARAHIVEGLLLALDRIDEIIAVIRASSNPTAACETLQLQFGLSESQAKAILDMRLARLTALERNELETEHRALVEEIDGYRAILASEELVLDIIREDLHELKERYGDPRRTEIAGEAADLSTEDFVTEEDMIVTVSRAGYIKRLPLTTYRNQGRGGKGVTGGGTKEGDFIEHLFIGSTHDYLLLFTDRGRVYWLKIYDIPQLSRTSLGRNIVNLVQIPSGETITSMVPVRRFDDEHYLIMVTEKGIVKRCALSLFGNPRQAGIIAANLDEDDRLVWVRRTSGSDRILLATRNGQAVLFKESEVRPMGRTAAGVRGPRLVGDDRVVGMVVPRPGDHILTACQNGFGKRTPVEEYRLTGRRAKGVINIEVSDRNGPVVACRAVRESDEIMLMSCGGMVVRTSVAEIRMTGRAAQGVRLMRLDDGDELVGVAPFEKEEADEGEPDVAEWASEDEAGGSDPVGDGEQADAPDDAETTPDEGEEEA